MKRKKQCDQILSKMRLQRPFSCVCVSLAPGSLILLQIDKNLAEKPPDTMQNVTAIAGLAPSRIRLLFKVNHELHKSLQLRTKWCSFGTMALQL